MIRKTTKTVETFIPRICKKYSQFLANRHINSQFQVCGIYSQYSENTACQTTYT